MTAYEQNERQGLSDKQLTEENVQLKRHIYEQEMKIGELQVNHTQFIESYYQQILHVNYYIEQTFCHYAVWANESIV